MERTRTDLCALRSLLKFDCDFFFPPVPMNFTSWRERTCENLKEGKENWKQSVGAVLLYDTKHGTNRHGLKLGCFVTIDKRGKTCILAGSFVWSEDEASFTGAYTRFLEAFQSHLMMLFTDSDMAMAAATKAVWPDVYFSLVEKFLASYPSFTCWQRECLEVNSRYVVASL